jgi:hypothetical protein
LLRQINIHPNTQCQMFHSIKLPSCLPKNWRTNIFFQATGTNGSRHNNIHGNGWR